MSRQYSFHATIDYDIFIFCMGYLCQLKLFIVFLHSQTFAIRDLNEQRDQINGICVLFCVVAVISFFSQFLQVCITRCD